MEVHCPPSGSWVCGTTKGGNPSMAEGNSDTVLYCSLFAASKYVQALSPDRLANTKYINMSFRSVPLTLHSLHIASEGGGGGKESHSHHCKWCMYHFHGFAQQSPWIAASWLHIPHFYLVVDSNLTNWKYARCLETVIFEGINEGRGMLRTFTWYTSSRHLSSWHRGSYRRQAWRCILCRARLPDCVRPCWILR